MMIPVLSVENLLSWIAQVTLIVAVGIAGPRILRIQHPRSQLVYFYILLVLSLALPFIQPEHTVLRSGYADSATRTPSLLKSHIHSIEDWAPAVAVIVTAGVGVRLSLFVL